MPSGKPFTVSVAKVPFRDTQGKIVGIVGIAHDITRRRQAEEERDRFFTISVDMICIAGFDGYFKRVNPAFETVLGYIAEEMTRTPWIEMVHPDDRDATIAEGNKLALARSPFISKIDIGARTGVIAGFRGRQFPWFAIAGFMPSPATRPNGVGSRNNCARPTAGSKN